MNITILSIGNKTPPELQPLIDEYIRRLPRNIRIDWQYLKHGQGADTTSKNHEAEKLLKYIKKTDFVILLDEVGTLVSSTKLSGILFSEAHQNITFVIGGAYGVANNIKTRADKIVSLSKLIFPHKIVRLVLAEQIYRSHCIHVGHPYHHS